MKKILLILLLVACASPPPSDQTPPTEPESLVIQRLIREKKELMYENAELARERNRYERAYYDILDRYNKDSRRKR